MYIYIYVAMFLTWFETSPPSNRPPYHQHAKGKCWVCHQLPQKSERWSAVWHQTSQVQEIDVKPGPS